MRTIARPAASAEAVRPRPADGRSARSARTRAAIADAVLAFLEEGRLAPTSLEIAARAGVAERTLFHHFSDLEALFAEVAARQFRRIAERFPSVPPEGDLATRIEAVVAHRAALHEFVGPVRRAALRQESRSSAIARRLAWARRELARDVGRRFAEELARRKAARRAELHAAVAVATSWSTWEQLRRHQGLAPDEARAVVRRLLFGLLAGPSSRRAGPPARIPRPGDARRGRSTGRRAGKR